MIRAVTDVLLWFSALGSGLVAGLFFTFSTFVMKALSNLPQDKGVSAMNEINRVILRSLFMPLFIGTTLASVTLAILGALRVNEPGGASMLLGGVVYGVGMFLCTILFNVPLNNELARVDAASAEAAPVWARYLKSWTLWNHLRAAASTIACALFIAALLAAAGG